jgi:hypothetical protein
MAMRGKRGIRKKSYAKCENSAHSDVKYTWGRRRIRKKLYAKAEIVTRQRSQPMKFRLLIQVF